VNGGVATGRTGTQSSFARDKTVVVRNNNDGVQQSVLVDVGGKARDD
jgi:hypothetical protein